MQVNSILRRTLQLRAYDFASHGVEVRERFSDPLPEVVGDSHQLQQVFLNILNNAYFVAKSLLLNRARKIAVDREAAAQSTLRVIRRNNQVVPWSEQKVEIAVRKTFLSQQRDSAPAVAVTQAVSARVHSSKQSFVHIEEIQDMVQEELMKAGHFKVAEAYILFRAQRAAVTRAGELSLSEGLKAEAELEELALALAQPHAAHRTEQHRLTLRKIACFVHRELVLIHVHLTTHYNDAGSSHVAKKASLLRRRIRRHRLRHALRAIAP